LLTVSGSKSGFSTEDRLKALAEDAVIVDDEEVASHYPLSESGTRSASWLPRTSMIPSPYGVGHRPQAANAPQA